MYTDNFLKAVFGALALGAIAFGQTTYEIDTAHSSAQFSVRHLMISNVKGEFSKVTGTIVYDPKNLAASKIDAVIDANTISTRDAKRDAHLKSPDFFDTAKYPTLTFKSKEFRNANGKLTIKGDLSLHGVTKEVLLNVDGPTPELKDPWGFTRVGATATTKINRKDWGLGWNQALETGGVVVGDEVTITLDIEATKKTGAATVSKASAK
jgi:polyisoprenoid-binding protein YceI